MKRLKILYFVINANISFEFILLIMKEHFVHAKGHKTGNFGRINVDHTSGHHKLYTSWFLKHLSFAYFHVLHVGLILLMLSKAAFRL